MSEPETTAGQRRYPIVYLGSFGWARGPCAMCQEMGGRSVWLCAGQLLTIHLCAQHAAQVPAGNLMIEALFSVTPGRRDDQLAVPGRLRIGLRTNWKS